MFLQFDTDDTFYVTNEDVAFESSLGGTHTRSVANGFAFGDYVIEDDSIRFTNYTAVSTNSRTYTEGVLSREDDTTYATEFGEGLSPFTCSHDTLNLTKTVAGFTLSHVYTRVAD